MIEAVWHEDVEMVRWLASKFPGVTGAMNVVDRAASFGSLEILQVFYDQDTEGPGLNVQWEGNLLADGVRSRSIEVVEWLYEHVPSDPWQQNTALEAAVCSGSIDVAEWLLVHGAMWTRGPFRSGRVGKRRDVAVCTENATNGGVMWECYSGFTPTVCSSEALDSATLSGNLEVELLLL